MCIQNTLQSKIAELTQNGETIAVFLADTLQGASPAIKVCHQLDAARMLTRYGFPQQDNIVHFPAPSMEEGRVKDEERDANATSPDARDRKAEPTLRDVAAYPVARYIRSRTDNGETLVEALCQIMEDDRYRPDPFTGRPMQSAVKPRHRLAAAKELLRRAFGESAKRRNSEVYDPTADIDESDPVNSDLARLIRHKTDYGIEAAEFMIRVAESDESADDWTPEHRLGAARELLHRAYDLNYDAVTWQHVEAYHRATEIPDEGERLEHTRIQAGRIAIIREFNEAYKTGDEEAMRNIEDKLRAYDLYIDEGKTPDEAMKYASCGPNDPDPDADDPDAETRYQPLSPEEQAKFNRELTQLFAEIDGESDDKHDNSAAAQVHAPKLTIQLNNRSP